MCLFQGRISYMFEGWFGEKKTQVKLWFSLNKELYRRFHDVIIPSSNGTTQVDHILVSPFGLFIVETKNLKGWIYGSETQSNHLKLRNLTWEILISDLFIH